MGRPLEALAIAVSFAIIAAPAVGQAGGERPAFTPPSITPTVTCASPFEWTLGLKIVDDVEVAYFTLQPQGSFGLTSVVTAEPGQRLVEWSLPGNSTGRRLLILAADIEGNASKVVVEVPETHCGAQPSPS